MLDSWTDPISDPSVGEWTTTANLAGEDDAETLAVAKVADDGFSQDSVAELAATVGATAGAAVCVAYGLAAAAPVCGMIGGAVTGWLASTVWSAADSLFSDSDELKAYEARLAYTTQWADAHFTATAANAQFYRMLEQVNSSLLWMAADLHIGDQVPNLAAVTTLLRQHMPARLAAYWTPYTFSGAGQGGLGAWMTSNPLQSAVNHSTPEYEAAIRAYAGLAADLVTASDAAAAAILARAATRQAEIEIESAEQSEIQFALECMQMAELDLDTPASCDPHLAHRRAPSAILADFQPAVPVETEPSMAKAAAWTIGTGVLASLAVAVTRKAIGI